VAKLNVKIPAPKITTHEGAPAVRINAELQLRRVVMACMLWENQFYIDGVSQAEIIAESVSKVPAEVVAEIAVDAREKQKLRHVPLFLVRELARRKDVAPGLVSKTLARVIQRADELTEFLAIYWRDGKQPLSAQVKKGLAAAFLKFDAYQLAKYDRDEAVKLRDVLFLSHARPAKAVRGYTKMARKAGAPAPDGSELFAAVVNRTLETPDTWEVAISAAPADQKKAEWTRLLMEGKLGALALLRNLRNMQQAGVDEVAIRAGLATMKTERVLPFRFIAAARYAPRLEDAIEPAMLKCLGDAEKLSGRTVLLVDVSGSMDSPISAKSDLQRMDAACGLAILLREVCESVQVVSFSERNVDIPRRHGFALRDAINRSQSHSSTYTGRAVTYANRSPHDRLIVITDEQSHDALPAPIAARAYVINVAAYQNGAGYKRKWHHIDGWSEAVIDYIRVLESTDAPR